MVQSLSVLGSTGSIGRQTLAVAKHLGLRVAALTANRQVDLLEQQARFFHPEFVAVYEEDAARQLKTALADTDIRVGSGLEAVTEAASLPASDCVVTAVSGAIGLQPTLAAIREKKRIGLANKETLVCAGELVMQKAKETGAEIVPVEKRGSQCRKCKSGIDGILRTENGRSVRVAINGVAVQCGVCVYWSFGGKHIAVASEGL